MKEEKYVYSILKLILNVSFSIQHALYSLLNVIRIHWKAI